MDRLTERFENGQVGVAGCGKNCKYSYKYCENAEERCPVFNEIYEKLAAYEDAEEQGLLLRLPCGIGTDIYYIPSEENFRLNLLDGHGEENRVFHQTVDRITFRKNGWYMECDSDLEYGTGRILLDTSYGVTWFLTSEEAEAKLKEMEGSHE